MATVLLVVHIIIAISMIGIILLQKNEGGGLGMGGGTMGGLMSTRGTANLLTRVTAVLATLFFLSTLGLALLFKGSNESRSILDAPVSPVNSKVSSPAGKGDVSKEGNVKTQENKNVSAPAQKARK